MGRPLFIGETKTEDADDGDSCHAGDQDKDYFAGNPVDVQEPNGGGHLNGRDRVRRLAQGMHSGIIHMR